MSLLTGAAAVRAREVVADIAAALRDPSVYDDDPDLRFAAVGRGTSGAAVFFAELAAETGDERDGETALAFLDAALESASEDQPNALLYPGSVGVGWALAYFERSLLEPDDGVSDVDDLVARTLSGAPWPSADLIRGVTGTGVYLLERLPRPHARAALDGVVATLEGMSESGPEGTTWYVPPDELLEDRRKLYPDGLYDVGMAHGQAGCVAILAAMTAAGVTSAKPLLESSTAWLIAQKLPDDKGPGRYPLLIGKGETEPDGGRLAWCYGDAGVAIALLAAGRALGDEAIVREALDLALDAAARTDDHAVSDAPLCHGSAGLMQIFLRLAQQLDDERLADAGRRWFEVAMRQRRTGEAVAGYGHIRNNEDPPYHPCGGFLEGATGVGLALLSATSDRDPGWDSLLLTKPVPL